MDQRQLFLRDVLATLFKRKMLIVSFLVVVVVLVFVGNMLWPETYESMAKVQVKKGREIMPDPSVLEGVAMPMIQMSSYDVNTIIDLVYSNDVLEEVVRETGIASGGGPVRILRDAARNLAHALGLGQRGDPIRDAVEDLRQAVKVDPVRESYVLGIRVRMGTAELARLVLTSLITQFQETHKEVYREARLETFFRDQLERVSATLAEAQKTLEDYRNAHQIVALDTERDLLVEQYTTNQRLLEQLGEIEAMTAAVEGGGADDEIVSALSRRTESTVVTEVQLRLFDKVVERNQMVNSLGPNHPKVVGVNKEIARLSESLRSAIVTTRGLTHKQNEEILTKTKLINERLGELDNLERDVRLAQDSYEFYANKIEESLVYDRMAEENISSIRITSTPTAPDSPVSPRRMLNFALALIGGLIGGVALAFFLEYLDHGLKTPEDVECFLRLAPLASFFRSAKGSLDAREAQRLASLLESERFTGGSVRFVAVTSAIAGEGAGRVARALAEAQAEDPDARALLLDFTGEAAKGASAGRGILDVLEGRCSLDDVLGRSGRLYTVGLGTDAECPAYLWRSDRMKAMFEGLRGEFERLVVLVAPILSSHDAVYATGFTDGVLLVVRADSTRREVVHRALETLGDAKAHVVGAVLTDRRQVIPQAVYRRI